MYSKAMLDLLGFKYGDKIDFGGASYLIVSVDENGLTLVTTRGLYNSVVDLDKRGPTYAFFQPYAKTKAMTQAERELANRRAKLSIPCHLKNNDEVLFGADPDVRFVARCDAVKTLYFGTRDKVIGITDYFKIARNSTLCILPLQSTTAEQLKALLVADSTSGVTSTTEFQPIELLSARYYDKRGDACVMGDDEERLFANDLPAEFRLYRVVSLGADHYFVVDYYPRSIQNSYDPTIKTFLVRKAADQRKVITDTILEVFKADIADPGKLSINGLPESEPQPSYVYADNPLPDFVDLGSEQDNDLLPDMTGFEADTLGAAPHLWRSPGYLLADRDLAVGERVHAWVVRAQDGRVVKSVALTADEGNKAKAKWPVAFLEAVNAAPDAKAGGKMLCAGRLADTGALEVGKDCSPTTSALAGMSNARKTDLNRLWCYGEDHRLFTNAPFSTNQVTAGRLPDMNLPQGESVVVQVRDRTTQHLYETHLFTPQSEGDRALTVWPMAFCAFINARNHVPGSPCGMVRAGVLDSDGVTVSPAQRGNRLWVPQCSDLSVEVDAVTWRKYREVGEFTPTVGATLHFFLYDLHSPAQLTGSPFSYTVKQSDSDAATCLASLATELQASALGDYLRLGGRDAADVRPDTANGWALWQMSLPVRVIVVGVPGLTGEYERALKSADGENLTLGDLYERYKDGLTLRLTEQWGGRVVESWGFFPEQAEQTDRHKWLLALHGFLTGLNRKEAQFLAWGEDSPGDEGNSAIHASSGGETLWLSRDSQLAWVAAPSIILPSRDNKERPNFLRKLVPLRNKILLEGGEVYGELRELWNSSVRPEVTGFEFLDRYSEEVMKRLVRWPLSNLSETENLDSTPAGDIERVISSRVLRGSSFYLKKDLWQISLPQGLWMDCVSCTRGEIVLEISKFQSAWYPLLKVSRLFELARLAETQGSDFSVHSACPLIGECREILRLKYIRTALRVFIEIGLCAGIANSLLLLMNAVSKADEDSQERLVRSECRVDQLQLEDHREKINLVCGILEKLKNRSLYSSRPVDFVSVLADSLEPRRHGRHSVVNLSADLDKWISDARDKAELAREEVDEVLKEDLLKVLQISAIRRSFECHDAYLQARLIVAETKTVVGLMQLQIIEGVLAKGVGFVSFSSDLGYEVLCANPLTPPDSPRYSRHGGIALYVPYDVKITQNFALARVSSVDSSGVTSFNLPSDKVSGRTPVGILTIFPPITGQPFIPSDSLCVDYSNTQGSEVYDASGASVNGVDPRTGLFHAHYPMGVVRGTKGKGPDLDLTLHYSATRANESALGDGWAFRFSVYDNFQQRLTLSTGQTLTLTAAYFEQASGNNQLAINGVTLTGAKGSLYELTELTILFPSGRREHLAKPILDDGVEPGATYKKSVLDALSELKKNLKELSDKAVADAKGADIQLKAQQVESLFEGLLKLVSKPTAGNALAYSSDLARWAVAGKLAAIQAKNTYQTQLDALAEREKAMQCKAYRLVPDTITSPQGGAFALAWEGKAGHIRLSSISEGGTTLLTASHDDPKASGSYSSTFTLWPDTDEVCVFKLAIEDCLLRRLTRQGKDQVTQQEVVFGYEGEPSLDRVLCSVAEQDGSLEVVSYAPAWQNWKSGDPMPLSNVIRHTLVPGANQQVISHIWQWKGINNRAIKDGETFSSTCMRDTGNSEPGPFIRRTWTRKNGLDVETQIVEEIPGVARQTTTHSYPDSIASTDASVRFRLATQPISTTVTTEDLHSSFGDDPAPTSPVESSTSEKQP